jgi:hypothetical protein
MGGHGGLNILPQKKWNVYNFDNREKVKKDEEAAAKEEQLKREQSRKRDAEFRLEKLRQARGLASSSNRADNEDKPEAVQVKSEPKSNHINLFEGIKIFDPVKLEDGDRKFKKMKKEPLPPRVVLPEDEAYRLGYGLVGKGVKLPWYMSKPIEADDDSNAHEEEEFQVRKDEQKKNGTKTIEEMREERLKRERREKERERALILENKRKNGLAPLDRGYSRRYI